MQFLTKNIACSSKNGGPPGPTVPVTPAKVPRLLTDYVRDPLIQTQLDVKSHKENEFVVIDRKVDPSSSSEDPGNPASDVKVCVPWRTRFTTGKVGAMLSASLASMYGKLPVPFRLPISVSLSTNSSGTLTAVTPIDPTAASEWTSLSALFDEYKVSGGHLKFQVSPQSSLTATQTPDSMFVIAYDPIEGVPLTSVRNGCELAKHQLIGGVATNGGPNVSFASHAKDGMHSFQFSVPQGNALNVVSGVVVTTTGWYSTLSTSNIMYWGYLKTFCQTGTASVTTPLVGMLYLDIEFRCRS